MTTLSSEAVRLADALEDMTCIWSPSDNRDLVNKAAALLRRIPELEAERDRIAAIADELQDQLDRQATRFAQVEAQRDQLRAELEKVRVPEGWSIKKIDSENAVVINGPIGGCVAVKDADLARVIPENILYELACAMLASPTPPHAYQKGQW